MVRPSGNITSPSPAGHRAPQSGLQALGGPAPATLWECLHPLSQRCVARRLQQLLSKLHCRGVPGSAWHL